jgi:inorganic triphosphatase YgiF
METELKLRFAEPDGQAAFLADTWTGDLVLPDSRIELDMVSHYFDTADLTLTGMKTSLRIRKEGEERVASLKMGDEARNGLHQRLEWQVRLDDETWPDQGGAGLDLGWFARYASSEGDPDELLRDILQRIAGQPLAEICQARFRRIAFAVGYGDTLMELALDQGELMAEGLSQPVNELELELKEGDVRDLVSLGQELMARFQLVPEGQSKYARCISLLRQARREDA